MVVASLAICSSSAATFCFASALTSFSPLSLDQNLNRNVQAQLVADALQQFGRGMGRTAFELVDDLGYRPRSAGKCSLGEAEPLPLADKSLSLFGG